jgi:2'-5' RNA ligase
MNKYLVAILPPEPFATGIYQLKEYFRDKYGSKASLNSPAHITLHMPFEFDNEELLSKVHKLQFHPFQIELKDFGCFEPGVIFIDVKQNESLRLLQGNVASFFRHELNVFNSNYRDHPFHPHVTVAFRDLKKPMFEEAWSEFKHKIYNASFECTKISILKHDGKFWREFS